MALTVLVCGGRHFNNVQLVCQVLDSLPFKIGKIVNGAAKGADYASTVWAVQEDVELKEYPPNWNLGKHAGILRNAEMLKEEKIDLVIAFPGGPGTKDMMTRSRAAGIEVIEVKIIDEKVKLFSSFPKSKSHLTQT